MNQVRRVAVVTGANRGLGFETARQMAQLGYRVVLTSRDGIKGKAAADKLQSERLDVRFSPLDVSREESRSRLIEFVAGEYERLDVLINNAGIMVDGAPDEPQKSSFFDVGLDLVRETMETNVYGPYRLIQLAVPQMRRHGYGRIVNLSSGLGQLAEMRGSFPAYRMSKTALNALTRIAAAELKGENILINACSPGWVRTRMGGKSAPREAAEAVRGITWLATLQDDGPSGGFFQDRMSIPW
ncbi:NAD(P)-dependent dehydrogenase (short-subunit alcohol dehydrogenase family) [Natronocella acetinitrilica]|uniref:NAD(P)-dependent dehydrogenase (Short-subunit alcohol dehydrogenase family) n=1 Tax=Natronocella acetinitrilica TaxID=414046 RepID=A0AAE3G6K6_9GAMM|nr:SDR family oxidoreductase [Natronocella acetinitrilica]MCP1676073.1 NAD(P)-dependent dehydrogenase (short-subunit alcohol dehydrogenase family) [Natronocella acetinitrilica]